MSDDIFTDRWHWCALAAGFQAWAEGRLADGAYVKRLAYALYEGGAFRSGMPALDASPTAALWSAPTSSLLSQGRAGRTSNLFGESPMPRKKKEPIERPGAVADAAGDGPEQARADAQPEPLVEPVTVQPSAVAKPGLPGPEHKRFKPWAPDYMEGMPNSVTDQEAGVRVGEVAGVIVLHFRDAPKPRNARDAKVLRAIERAGFSILEDGHLDSWFQPADYRARLRTTRLLNEIRWLKGLPATFQLE